jgi:hypothetical protein
MKDIVSIRNVSEQYSADKIEQIRKDGNACFKRGEYLQARELYQSSLAHSLEVSNHNNAIICLNNLINVAFKIPAETMLSTLESYYETLMDELEFLQSSSKLSNKARWKSLGLCNKVFNSLEYREQINQLSRYRESNHCFEKVSSKSKAVFLAQDGKDRVNLMYYYNQAEGVGLKLCKQSAISPKGKMVAFYLGVKVDQKGCFQFNDEKRYYPNYLSNSYTVTTEINNESISFVGSALPPSALFAGQLCNDAILNEKEVSQAYLLFQQTNNLKTLWLFDEAYHSAGDDRNNATISSLTMQGDQYASGMCVIADRDLLPGEKVYVSYGALYWATAHACLLRAKGEVKSSAHVLSLIKQLNQLCQSRHLGFLLSPTTMIKQVEDFTQAFKKPYAFDNLSSTSVRDAKKQLLKQLSSCGKIEVIVGPMLRFNRACQIADLHHLFLLSAIVEYGFVKSLNCSVRDFNHENVDFLTRLRHEYQYIEPLLSKISGSITYESENQIALRNEILLTCVNLILAQEIPLQNQFPSPLFFVLAKDCLFAVCIETVDSFLGEKKIDSLSNLKRYLEAPCLKV